MKIKQRFSTICWITIFILLFNACSSTNPSDENENQNPVLDSCVYINDDGDCKNVTFSSPEKSLFFDAKVRVPKRLDSISNYTISVSEEYFEHIAEDLLTARYKECICNKSKNSTEYYASNGTDEYSILNIDETGHLYYDTSSGISGTLVGELFGYNTFVDSSDYTLPIEMDEAIEIAISFAESYSDLDFVPYRVLIEYDRQKECGCYRVYLQAQVEGLPICELSSNPTNTFMVNFSVDSSGITYFQGKLCYDNTTKGDLVSILSFDEIMEIFKTIFSFLMYKDAGIVYDISLEYNAQMYDEGIYNLRPIWCFHIRYEDSFDTISFFADTGELCHTGKA